MRTRSTWFAGALVAAAVGLGSIAGHAAAAATPPPPVADLHAAAVYDHTVVLKFLVPAAYYDAGAVGILRVSPGRTGPARPTDGYFGGFVTGPTTTSRRDLQASTTYTIGIWIRDHGLYSAPRYVTLTTRRDVTPPAPITNLRAAPTLSYGLTPGVYLRWTPSSSLDARAVTIVRTSSTWADRTAVITGTAGLGFGYLDSGAAVHRGVLYRYYVAARDTSGYLSPYSRVDVATDLRRIGGRNDPSRVSVFDSTGTPLPEPNEQLPALAGRYFVPSDGHWAMNVHPGRYTACSYAPQPEPGAHMQYISGCWGTGINPGGATYDWNEDPASFPPPAHNAVDTTAHDVPAGIDVQLVIS